MLTALQVKAIKTVGRHSTGQGVYLEIDATGAKRWLYRYQLNGKRTWHGLGPYNEKTNNLAVARKAALKVKQLISEGTDPVEVKAKERAEKVAALDSKRSIRMTFETCAAEWYERNKSGWSNPKHRQQIQNTLRDYVMPHIGKEPIADIDIEGIKRCLDPIWDSKTETASRVRQRIESIFSFAIVHGHRSTSNPAQWKGFLDQIYGNPEVIKRNRRHKTQDDGHYKALPFSDLPSFYKELSGNRSMASHALRFTILTASRTGPILAARWDEFDLQKCIWTIPASNMKTKKIFRVALNKPAVELISSLPRLNQWVFAGDKPNKPLSAGAMHMLLRRMNKGHQATVHGFRSTFRDWVGEATSYPSELAEHALSHQVGGVVERAYARGDQLDKRFELMKSWGEFAISESRN